MCVYFIALLALLVPAEYVHDSYLINMLRVVVCSVVFNKK